MIDQEFGSRPKRNAAASQGHLGGTKLTRRGLLVVLTGDGKGKSTAAWGMALRAVGRGRDVRVFQFTKASSARLGEYRAFARLGITMDVLGQGFDWDCRSAKHCEQLAGQSWARARAALQSDEPFMVILDDLLYPLRQGWLVLDEVLQSLHSRPAHMHVVVTGRNAPQNLLDLADTVTRMGLTKHHYMQGIAPQRGIED
jgi:cob(I)alamin adenosyltransferase